MNRNVRTQRSITSRLNGVALTKYTGVWDVRKKFRIAGMPSSGRVVTTRSGAARTVAGAPGMRARTTIARATAISTISPTIHQNAVTVPSPDRHGGSYTRAHDRARPGVREGPLDVCE